jgi:hypothetical protein
MTLGGNDTNTQEAWIANARLWHTVEAPSFETGSFAQLRSRR